MHSGVYETMQQAKREFREMCLRYNLKELKPDKFYHIGDWIEWDGSNVIVVNGNKYEADERDIFTAMWYMEHVRFGENKIELYIIK